MTRKNRDIFFLIMEISWFWFITVAIVTQFPAYTKTILGGNSKIIALLLVIFSIGVACGSLVCNYIYKGAAEQKFVPLSALVMSLVLFDICWVSRHFGPGSNIESIAMLLRNFNGLRLCLDLFLFAVAGGIYIVPLYAMLQVHSENNYRAQSLACNNIFSSLFGLVASILIVACLELGLVTTHIYLIVGVLNLLVVFLVRQKINT